MAYLVCQVGQSAQWTLCGHTVFGSAMGRVLEFIEFIEINQINDKREGFGHCCFSPEPTLVQGTPGKQAFATRCRTGKNLRQLRDASLIRKIPTAIECSTIRPGI